jgi:hypothetical protein
VSPRRSRVLASVASVASVAFSAFSGWAVVAHAETAPQPPASVVEVYSPPCIEHPYDRAGLIELLRVELGALGVTDVVVGQPRVAGNRRTAGRLLAAVVLTPNTCDPATVEVTLQILDRASSKKVERPMAIGDVELAGRPRALAIAIAELLQASWAELEFATAAPPAVPVPPALRAALAAKLAPGVDSARAEMRAAFEARHPSLELSGVAQSFPTRATALLGAELSIRSRFGEHGAWHLGVGTGFGSTEVGIGAIAIGAATGSVGVAFTTGGTAEFELGPRLDAGYGWATGTARSSNVRGKSYGNGVVLGLVEATLRVHSESWWTLLLGLDVGQSIADVSFLSDTAQAAGIGGVVVDARIGAGARL